MLYRVCGKLIDCVSDGECESAHLTKMLTIYNVRRCICLWLLYSFAVVCMCRGWMGGILHVRMRPLHIQKLKPDWEKLGEATDCNKVTIARIDCDNEDHAMICQNYEVQGYPTLKGFPEGDDEGEDYESGRDLDSLKAYISDDLSKPICSVGHEDACDDAQLELLTEYAKMSPDAIVEAKTKLEETVQKANADLDELIAKLTKEYEAGLEMSKTIKAEVKVKMRLIKQFVKAVDNEEEEEEEATGGTEL